MYNSKLVGFLSGIGRFAGKQYRLSILHKGVNWWMSIFNRYSKGSFFMGIFMKSKSNIETSLFFKMYLSIIDLINKFINMIRKFIRLSGKESVVYNLIYENFKDFHSLMVSLSIFLFSIGIGVLGIGLIKAEAIVLSTGVGVILILMSIVLFLNSNNFKEIIQTSLTFRFINDIFSIDKGGEQWW